VPGLRQLFQRAGHSGVVVEDDLGCGRCARDAVADRHEDGAPRDLAPVSGGRVNPKYDQCVDPLIDELRGQHLL
jgi:hypothetical protein